MYLDNGKGLKNVFSVTILKIKLKVLEDIQNYLGRLLYLKPYVCMLRKF